MRERPHGAGAGLVVTGRLGERLRGPGFEPVGKQVAAQGLVVHEAVQLPAYIHEAIVCAYIQNASHLGLRDLIPGATLGLVPAAGHLIHYDAPAALMNEIRGWLDSQPGARGSSPDQP